MLSYQDHYECHGLLDTLKWFDDYVYEHSHQIVRPSWSFAHIVIDDYNLGDASITFCLDRADEYFCERFLDFGLMGCNIYSDNEWENWLYWDLVNGVCLIVDFLEWLLTIDEDERDNVGYD